jgi:Domain of Unknown Function (DUF1080)
MRTAVTVLAIGLVAGLLTDPQVACQDRSEWADLFARDLRDWSRDGSGPSPWRLTADRTLASAPAAEQFGPDWELRDGTLRFEYRFVKPAEGKAAKAPKAALHVRRTEGSSGCRIALGENCGAITTTFVAGSDRDKTVELPAVPGLAREPGYWNQVKVTLRGKGVDVYVNGRLASSCEQGDSDHGRIAFEVDGTEVEFRRVMWKAAE